jgi:hypothetical protein
MMNQLPIRLGQRGGKSRSGMTLLETLLALFSGIIVAGAVMLTCVFVAGSFVAVGDYSDLNKSSRTVIDNMSRNIRGASHYGSMLYTNSLTLTNIVTLGGVTTISSFTYYWDPANNTLYYQSNGVSTVLLTNCDTLSFAYYQRTITNGFAFSPTTNSAEVKMVSVAWRCSKKIYGRKINTESIQNAQICVRN